MGEIGVMAGSTGSAALPGPAVRPDEVEPFLAGAAFPAGGGASYPRADPRGRDRLPADTWGTATIPVGVRLEFVGDAPEVEIGYVTLTGDLGYRGTGAGTAFSLWRGGVPVSEEPAAVGEGSLRLATGLGSPFRVSGVSPSAVPDGRFTPAAAFSPTDRCIVYLPEGMKPTVLSITAIGGDIEPAPARPRWIAYGDSIAEGWTASSPANAWPAVAGRRFDFDVVNMGYAGAARGEIVSAEQIASLGGPVAPASSPAPGVAVISITHGTNCWTRVPHSEGMVFEGTRAFLSILREGHPGVPIVVASPVIRPDAESTRNRLGASLADLRRAIEAAASEEISAGDRLISLLPGASMIGPEHLADGIHPNDAGHQIIAETIGAVAVALTRAA